MKVAYSYSRVSSVEQIKGGGLERQLQLAKDYCRKHGYLLDESTTYSEKGRSAFRGANADTGKLGVILKLIASGAIPKGAILLVENLDRLARTEATEAMALFLQIINAGITVVTLVDDKTYNKAVIDKDPTSLLISLIYFIRSNDESKMKQARITDAWRRQRFENIKKGKKDRHNLPSWLTLKNDSFAVLPEKVKTARRVFELFLKEKLGVNLTAKRLNAEGIPTLTGRKWTACTVKFVLRNRALIGEYHVGERVSRNVKRLTGMVIKDYYPAVIDSKTFESAQHRFLLHPPKRGRPKINKADDWLTPLLKCGYCGGAVGAEHHATSKSYICWRSVNGGCVRCGINRKWTRWALQRVLRDSVKEYVATMPTESKLQETEIELAETKKKMSNLTKLVEAGIEDAVERALILKQTQKELESKLAQLAAASATENVEVTDETLAGVSRRYINKVKVFFAGTEEQKLDYLRRTKGKSGGFVNFHIRPTIVGISFLEVYFNAPWEDRGWRVLTSWSTLPKLDVAQFKVSTKS